MRGTRPPPAPQEPVYSYNEIGYREVYLYPRRECAGLCRNPFLSSPRKASAMTGVPRPTPPGRPEARVGWRRRETGEGGSVPLSPQAASPNGESHHGPVQGSPPAPPQIRLPTRYRHALPTPPPGRGRSAAGAGGVGVLARSKMVGVWETGEGEQVPPPRQPYPPWRYPHGPQHGEILEKSRIRFPAGSTPDTAAHQVSQARTPPREWGCRQRSMGGLPAEG